MPRRYKVQFEIELPGDVVFTDDELVEWARFEFNDNGCIKSTNPLYGIGGVDPVFGTFEISEA